MLRVSIWRVREGKESKLRAWLEELNSRKDEVRETFRDETVRAEQAYIVPTGDAQVLVYVIEAEDIERGAKAYAESTHKIDAEHRAVMKECLEESLKLAPIYDVGM
jgi:hypothetical protein